MTGGIELISQSVTKSYTLLERIQQTSLPKLKKVLESIEKVDKDDSKRDAFSKEINEIFDEFEGVFGELGEHTKTENLKELYELIENIEGMVPKAIKCMNKTVVDPKYKLLREDLRYLVNNKQKTTSPTRMEAKRIIVQAVKSMTSLAKLTNKYLTNQYKIKIKPPDHYTNKIKRTDEHWEIVLNLVEQKQAKTKHQIETHLSKENVDKIKSSSVYRSFEKDLQKVNEFMVTKTTQKNHFEYY